MYLFMRHFSKTINDIVLFWGYENKCKIRPENYFSHPAEFSHHKLAVSFQTSNYLSHYRASHPGSWHILLSGPEM